MCKEIPVLNATKFYKSNMCSVPVLQLDLSSRLAFSHKQ